MPWRLSRRPRRGRPFAPASAHGVSALTAWSDVYWSPYCRHARLGRSLFLLARLTQVRVGYRRNTGMTSSHVQATFRHATSSAPHRRLMDTLTIQPNRKEVCVESALIRL